MLVNNPYVTSMMKYGHASFNDMLNEIKNDNEYVEDLYGDEIKIGDEYYKTKSGELIHSKNIVQFAEDELDIQKKIR